MVRIRSVENKATQLCAQNTVQTMDRSDRIESVRKLVDSFCTCSFVICQRSSCPGAYCRWLLMRYDL